MKVKEPYQLFSEPLKYYNSMLDDINAAKSYIYIETFRFGDDEMGNNFATALIKARKKRDVEVKLLVDYWGAGNTGSNVFERLKKGGVEVRFFEKIKYNFDVFTKGHRRNHRKLLIIDDKIVYIGSSNITAYNINWRESVLRMKSGIAVTFKKLLLQDWKLYNQYVISRNYNTKVIKYYNFSIFRDVPNIAQKKINRLFINMIKNAQKSVYVETPYFLPGYLLRRALMSAAKRGVQVTVIIPKKSDVRLVDILRNKYIGPLSVSGIKFLFYETNNLHSKLLLIDEKEFAIGSSNFDYRSFRYMFEIVLKGNDPDISGQIFKHITQTVSDTTPFIYEAWKNRPYIDKFFEWLLVPFRHLL
jgi:cardiolipin synthase